ncbi:uncharacterized protein [Eurosta solidaginis]|uniref:uncharacterized protein isoform X2 n=1 Tax=Eurosta solidaginis TaxID=178769 RepID=UPI003530D635
MSKSETTEEVGTIKRRTFVGPWKDVKEFARVYKYLYGDGTDIKQQKLGLIRVNVWTLRRSTLCPAGVLATQTLLEVQHKDLETEGVHNMRTMYDTARLLELPSFVVDLRHICAHGQVLPPLDVLRSTVSSCLTWLRDYYWLPQLNTMCDVEASKIRHKDKTQFEENVTKLFIIYDAALECYCKGAHNMKSGKRHVSGKRLAQLRAYYAEQKLETLKDTLELVVQDLISLVKREIAIKDMSEILIVALLNMKYFFSIGESHSSGEPLEFIIAATQSFFRMLAVYGFIEDLFYSLIAVAENELLTENRRAGASFWATRIAAGFVAFRKCKQIYKSELDKNPNTTDLDFTSLNQDNISKTMKRYLIYAGVDLKCTPIFGDSMRRPWVWVVDRNFVTQKINCINQYTAPIVKSLLPLVEPPLTTAEIRGITQLVDAFFGKKVTVKKQLQSAVKNADTIHTAQELLEALKEQNKLEEMMDCDDSPAVSKTKQQFGCWTLENDDEICNWSMAPLGRFPWE